MTTGEISAHFAEIYGVSVSKEVISNITYTTLEASTDRLGREEVRGVVVAYERALDRAGKLLTGMVRLDVEGRLAAVDEHRLDLDQQQGRQFAAGIQWLTGELRVRLDFRADEVVVFEDLVRTMIHRLATGQITA